MVLSKVEKSPLVRLRRTLRAARERRETQAIASFWLGWGAVGATVLGVLIHVPDVTGCGVLIGVAAIVTARFTRQRARAMEDNDLLYLSRYGQITGWLAVGPMLILLLLVFALLGFIIGLFSHLR